MTGTAWTGYPAITGAPAADDTLLILQKSDQNANAAGTVHQVPAASFVVTVTPSGVTSGVTDAANISAAIAALPASGGVVKLSATAQWYVECGQVSATTGQYIDAAGCFINAVGAGDVFRFVDTSTYEARTSRGGGLLGDFIIDGTATTGNSSGVHAGDILDLEINAYVKNFTAGTTSKCFWFDNENYWTEWLHGRIRAENGTAMVVFDVGGTDTSTGSFMRCSLEIYLNQVNPTNDGVVFQNGAFVTNGALKVRGNFGTSASALTSAVLRLTGTAPAGHAASASNISDSFLDIGAECAAGNADAPQTIVFGSGSNFITGMGLLNFGASSPFAASNNAGNITGIFSIAGDNSLLSGLAFPTNVAFDAGLNVGNYVSSTSVTANGQSIPTVGVPSLIPLTSTAARTGLILAGAGTASDGQLVVVYNAGSFPLTFAAPGTSFVADGTSDVIPAGQMAFYVWSYNAQLWYRIGGPVYAGANGLPQVTSPAGLTSYVQQSQAAATSAVTVASSAAIASLGSVSVPASDPVAGAVYRFTLNGVLGTAGTAPTYVCDIRWGGTGGTLLTSLFSTGTPNSTALAVSLSGVPILIEGEIEFRTSTTVTGWLQITWRNSVTAATPATVSLAVISSPVTVTTSSGQALSVDWTWGTSSASNTITIESSVFERVA